MAGSSSFWFGPAADLAIHNQAALRGIQGTSQWEMEVYRQGSQQLTIGRTLGGWDDVEPISGASSKNCQDRRRHG